MHGKTKVIDALNDVLTAELTAINQYFIHHKMCDNWGFPALSKHKRKESIEEMRNTLPKLNQILITTRATVIRLEQGKEALERREKQLVNSIKAALTEGGPESRRLAEDDAASAGPSSTRVSTSNSCVRPSLLATASFVPSWLNSMVVGSPSGRRIAGCSLPVVRSTKTTRP